MTSMERAALIEQIARRLCKDDDGDWDGFSDLWLAEAASVLDIAGPAIRRAALEEAAAFVEKLHVSIAGDVRLGAGTLIANSIGPNIAWAIRQMAEETQP